jgi:gas vesicle protein
MPTENDNTATQSNIPKPGVDRSVRSMARAIGNNVQNSVRNLRDGIKDAGERVKQRSGNLRDGAKEAGNNLQTEAKYMRYQAQVAGEQIKDAAGERVKEGVDNLRDGIKDAGERVKQGAGNLRDGIKDAGERIKESAGNLRGRSDRDEGLQWLKEAEKNAGQQKDPASLSGGRAASGEANLMRALEEHNATQNATKQRITDWREAAAQAQNSMRPEQRDAQMIKMNGPAPVSEYVQRDSTRTTDRDPVRGVHASSDAAAKQASELNARINAARTAPQVDRERSRQPSRDDRSSAASSRGLEERSREPSRGR